MSNEQKPLEIIRDFLERATHWREGGADRHAALKEALPQLQDDIEWTEKGLAEWRDAALKAQAQTRMVDAQARIAIGHLHAVLNKARTHDEQQKADTAARDWLISIGSQPS